MIEGDPTSAARPTPFLGERFDRALSYAVALHALDVRKESDVPYVAHLLGVCSLVLESGGGEDEAIAALLHDAAEEHGGLPRLADIVRRFGADVAGIVAECSDSLVADPHDKAPWLERKLRYIESLEVHAAARPSVMLVSAADKLHNARSLEADLAVADDKERFFDRFNGGRFGTLWYYRRLSDVFLAHRGRHEQMARELDAIVERLSGGLGSQDLFALHQDERRRLTGAASRA